jgi:hypothetical protein
VMVVDDRGVSVWGLEKYRSGHHFGYKTDIITISVFISSCHPYFASQRATGMPDSARIQFCCRGISILLCVGSLKYVFIVLCFCIWGISCCKI